MSITRNILEDTAITRDFHERILTIDNTSDNAAINKLPVANQYGYLDRSWLQDYSSYKINPIGDLTNNFTTSSENSEFVNVITLKSVGLTITLSKDYVVEDVPYTRALVYRFLIYNPDGYDLTWESDVPDSVFIWNTYSETPPVLDENGTYIEFISTDNGLHWYGIATDMTAYDIVHNYYTKTESDDRFVNVTGDTMTGTLTIDGAHNNESSRAIKITGINQSHAILVQDTGVTKGINPESDRVIESFVSYGSDMSNGASDKLSAVYNSIKTTGENSLIMEAMDFNGTSSSDRNYISVGVDANGNNFTYSFTPDTADNSNNIATTAYVKNQNLVPAMDSSTKFMCLTNNGETSEWVRYQKTQYVHVITSNTTTITVPSQYMNNAIISDVYRDGVLLIDPDDYSINTDTLTITFNDTLRNGDKIIVTFENTIKVRSTEILDNIMLNNSTATTPDYSDNSNRIATTEYVNRILDNYTPGSGSSIPTHSPAFSGIPTAPTAAPGTNTTQIANTIFVNTAISNSNHAPIDSPAFSGTPTAPTPNASTNTTQIATTAFVKTNISNLVNGATLDTLKKLSDSINNDSNYYNTVNTALSNKINIGITEEGNGNGVSDISEVNGDITVTKADFSLSDHNHDSEYTALTSNVGSSINPIYTNSNGALTASTETVGSADSPVYLDNGIITSTEKNFSDYLPLTGGDITGELSVSESILIGDPESSNITITDNSIQSNGENSSTSDLHINENGGDVFFGDENTGQVSISNGVITASSFVGNIGGTSERASMDSEGNVIHETYAPLDSPSLVGTPTAPTAVQGDNSSQIATTSYVDTAVSNLVNSAPDALNTLNELAAALGNDENFATTITTELGTKLDADSSDYISSLSVDGTTITITKGDSTEESFTTQDTVYTAGSGITISNFEISADSQLPSLAGHGGQFLTTDGTSANWGNVLPSQANNNGKVLVTNGTTTYWGDFDALPDQTNNAGKFLTTDGIVASWEDINNIEVKISSVHYPSEGDTTITLTGSDVLPSDVSKYAIAVYRDGVYLNPTIDYTFNHNTNVLTFTKQFELDEIVTVIFSYISSDTQASPYLDIDEYEAGDNITFVNNPTTGKITINATESTATDSAKLGGIDASNYALLSSPELTGTPTAPTAVAGTSTTQIATTAFVTGAISDLVNGAPTTLDTLKEIADVLNDSSTGIGAVNTALSGKLNTNISTSGNGNAITSITDSNGNVTATKDLTFSLDGHTHDEYAPKASPALTGTPTAPTAETTTNSTQIATTAYVNNRFANSIENVKALTSAATITINPAESILFTLTLTRNTTINISSISNGYYTTNGSVITLFMPAHNYTVTWGSNITWVGGEQPDSDEYNIITFATPNGGTTWYGSFLNV